MKTKECGEYGKLEYRLPNIPEAMRLLGSMGINSKNINLEDNEMLYMAKLLESMGPFITKIDITIDETKINTFEELLNHFCMIEFLSDIGAELFNALSMQNKKK